MTTGIYYFLSLTLASSVILYLTNLILLRLNGRTTFGMTVKPGTPEYKRGIGIASSRNIAITAVVVLVLVGNLIYSVNRVLHLQNSDVAHSILLYGTGFFVLIFLVMIPASRSSTRKIIEMGKENARKKRVSR